MYYLKKIILIFIIGFLTNVVQSDSDQVHGDLVRDFLNDYNVKPLCEAEIKYGEVEIDIGDLLTVNHTKDEPTDVFFYRGQYGTVALFDIDVPSRDNPERHELLHWLVVNVRVNPFLDGSADVIVPYIAPDPPKGTGPHRYVFLVFGSDEKIERDNPIFSNISKVTIKNFMRNLSRVPGATLFLMNNDADPKKKENNRKYDDLGGIYTCKLYSNL